MNRPSYDSSRRIIPVQCWELVHTFLKKSEIINAKVMFFWVFFCGIFTKKNLIFKNCVTIFNHEKGTKEPKGKYPSLS